MRTELAADCATMNTAANPACLSLFSADAPARHLTPGAFAQQCRAPGVAATQTRTAAFRQLVLQAPAPVVARALGYSPETATCHVTARRREPGTATRPPAPGAERGTDTARQHAGSGFPIRRTRNDSPQGRCGRGS